MEIKLGDVQMTILILIAVKVNESLRKKPVSRITRLSG